MPKLQQLYPNEFACLKDQRAHALHEIQSRLVSLGAALKEGADPARWANAYPWATAGTAFGLGVTAGYVIVPGRGRGEVKTSATGEGAESVTPAADASPGGPGPVDGAETSNPLRDKLAAGAKSMVLGAAYGLGRLALNQILEGFMAGMHPPGDPSGPDSEFAAAHHAESFSWQPETPA